MATEAETRPKQYSVYVGNLPFSVRWGELKDLFKEVGDVVYADVPRDMQNRSRGFGIVRFSNAEDAEKAIETYDGYEYNGRKLVVREDQKQQGSSAPVQNESGSTGKKSAGFQVFVGNLAWGVSWQKLKDVATEHDLQPLKANVQIGRDGRSRGWGTLSFATEEEIQTAIDALNGIELEGRTIEVREDKK